MKRAIAGKPKAQQARKRHLLSGLIKCGECGGAYTVINADRYGCSHRRERGTCSNAQTIRISILENRILKALENEMLTNEMIREFSKGYEETLKEQRQHQNSRLKKAKKELREVCKKIDSMLNAIMDGLYGASMKEAMPLLEMKKENLQDEIVALEEDNVIQVKPNMAGLYKNQINLLTQAIKMGGNETMRASNRLRALIDSIVVSPNEKTGKANLELRGDLATLLNFATGKEVAMPMVAGVGFVHNRRKDIVSISV